MQADGKPVDRDVKSMLPLRLEVMLTTNSITQGTFEKKSHRKFKPHALMDFVETFAMKKWAMVRDKRLPRRWKYDVRSPGDGSLDKRFT